MAYTITRYHSVFGNKRAVGMVVDADAATQAIQTGLSVVEWFSFAPVSMNTYVGFKMVPNLNASGVAAAGTLGVSGVSVGDRFHVTVYGR